MYRLFIFALALLLACLPASGGQAQSRLYTSAQVVEWTTGQLNGYYRTLFALTGQEYEAPRVTLVPAGERVHTGCGSGVGAMMAFYCPADHQIVLSREFADALYDEDDFLPAYVIAHEYAHHIQNLSGTTPRYVPQEGDWDQVFTIENELRADCMAGTWMRSVAERGFLSGTDMSAVLLKASQIGDSGIFGRGSSHGAGVERLRAVFIGYEEGLVGCMAITPLPRIQAVPTPPGGTT